MKRRFNNYPSLIITLWLLLGIGSIVEANIVPDASFEAGSPNWKLQGNTVGFVSSPTRTGVNALKLINVGNGVNSPSHQVHQQRINGIVAGQEYIYSVWVSGNNLQGIGGGGKPLAVARWRDNAGNIIRTGDGKLKESYMWAPYGTYGFQQMAIALQAPSNAVFLDVLFRTWWGTTVGESYWDDISITPRDFSSLGGLVASYQAENAQVLSGGAVHSEHTDYTGSGYYDIDTNGAVIQWNNVVGGGNRILSFRYSWEGNEKNMELFINGVSQGARKPLPTGRRGIWASELWDVNLPASINTIKLKVSKSGGVKSQPLIDRLDVFDSASSGNQAPVLVTIGTQTVIEGELLNVSISAHDADSPAPLVLSQINSIPGNPEILTDFGNGVGELSWTPAIGSAAAGPYSVTVTATDGDGATVNETFAIFVTPQGGELSGTISGSAAITPANVNLSAVGSSDWIHWALASATDIDRKSGVIAQISDYTPIGGAAPQRKTNSKASHSWINGVPTVAVSNTNTDLRVFGLGKGFEFTVPASTTLKTLKVYLGLKNVGGRLEASLSDASAPTYVTQIDSFTAKTSRVVTLDFQAASAGQQLTVRYVMYSKPGSTGWVSLESAALLQEIQVSGNVAPHIISTAVTAAKVAETYSYNVDATDLNTEDSFSFALSNAPSGMSIDSVNGVITWIPTVDQVGDHPVSITVSDDGLPAFSDNQDFIVSVAAASTTNVAPSIASTAITTAVAGVVYHYNVDAIDINTGDTLSYFLTTAPAGMTIDPVTGLISWIPVTGQVGNQNVTVNVSDDGAPVFSDSQSFVIGVASASSGSLEGATVVAPASVALSTEGTADWSHWGLISGTDVNRKQSDSQQISDVSPVDGTLLNRGTNNLTVYSWINGIPTSSVSNTASGIRAYKEGKGFEFSVPADTAAKILKIYLGAKNVGGQLEARLSDGSAPTFITQINKFNGITSQVVTLNFQAASNGQQLIVRYTLYSKPGTTGWVSLEAATLQGQPALLRLPYSNDFSSGNVSDWISLDDTDTASNWRVNNGEYQQDAFVGFHNNAMQGGYHLGTYSVLSSATGLNDYQFSVKATPLTGSGQDIGVMVRVDPATDSYTRLSFSAANGFGRLESKVADIFTTLAKNARGYQPGTPLNITMQVQGSIIVAHVNGEKLFGAYDANPGSGTIGLYCRDQCAFDDVVLDNNVSAPSIVIAEPTSYSVSASTIFNVGAVVLNTPAGGSVEFQLDGQAAACTSASDLGHANFFTAECSASSQGTYQLTAVLENQEGVELDSDINQDVSVGDNYIAIGDSLSVGLDDNTVSDGSSQNGWLKSSMGYEAILMDHLAAVPSQQPTIIHKAATPGDRTSDTLNQRTASILERHLDANKAIVILGVNDAGGSFFTPSGLSCSGIACNGTYKGNLQALVEQLDAAGKSAIVALSPPRFGDPFAIPYAEPANHSRNLLIRDEYNVVIATELGLPNDQVGPDFYDYFLGGENRFYLYATNLHPNALGYAAMAHLLHNTITGDMSLPFVANNLCVRLTQAGSCESPLFYKQNLLEVGNRYYIDQTYTLLQTMPAVLNDGRWIMTKDLDRDLANTNHLSFNVPEISTLYVAYAANATTIPVWLENNFVDTGINLNTDNPAAPAMRLYSQDNVIGEIELPGANAAANGAAANYIVIVVKN